MPFSHVPTRLYFTILPLRHCTDGPAAASAACTRCAAAVARPVYERFKMKWMHKKTVHDSVPPPYVANWEPGFEDELRAALQQVLPERPDTVDAVVEAARSGTIPDRAGVLVPRVVKLLNAHRLFPGFDLHAAVGSDPSLLGYSTSRVVAAMRQFQDLFPLLDVGPAMPLLGRFILRDGVHTAAMLRHLNRLCRQHARCALPLASLSPACTFLLLPPPDGFDTLRKRFVRYAKMLGAERLAAVMSRDPSLLNVEVSDLHAKLLVIKGALGVEDEAEVLDLMVDHMHLAHAPLAVLNANINMLVRRSRAPPGDVVRQMLLPYPRLLSVSHVYLENGVAALQSALRLPEQTLGDMLLRNPYLLIMPLGVLRHNLAHLVRHAQQLAAASAAAPALPALGGGAVTAVSFESLPLPAAAAASAEAAARSALAAALLADPSILLNPTEYLMTAGTPAAAGMGGAGGPGITN